MFIERTEGRHLRFRENRAIGLAFNTLKCIACIKRGTVESPFS